MLEVLLAFWMSFVILSLAIVAYDIHKMPIDGAQKIGWILVTAYKQASLGYFFIIALAASLLRKNNESTLQKIGSKPSIRKHIAWLAMLQGLSLLQ